jgi:DNA-directed RNA polymerase II subunit RPB2
MKQQNQKTNEFRFRCNLYLGGKEGNRLYYGKPVIYDENREHYMYPNEARLRNMSYGITIHYDVEVEFLIRDEFTDELETKTILIEKIFLGRFPIMIMSDLCILKGLDKKVKFELGECKNDYGAYFIIDGLEKCIVPQEKFADNMLYIRDKESDLYSHSAEIRSVSEDASKPIRTLSIKIVMPTPSLSNNQIVVNIPNVRKPVPLFILMRALGIESDKEIIEFCLLDMDKYKSYVDLFIPSIHDAGRIFTQEGAINYIGSFTKGHTDAHALEILTNYLLPHVGEMNFRDKAYFIGYMVRQLLNVYTKENKATDRDNFRFKRVELPGALLYDLFKEYYTLQQRDIYLKIDKEYLFHQGQYNSKEGFFNLIEENYKAIFSDRIVENGFKKAFKGKWGSEEHTERVGVVQDLNRLSYNSYISHLRKINLPLDASAKVVGPRLLHSSQWGIIDPVDTPDGGNAGLHKHMTIVAHITTGCSSYPVIKWLRLHSNLKLLAECSPFYVSTMCKVIVNGNWMGVISNPKETQSIFKENRRVGIIPPFISIQWNIETNTIYIYTDSGRLCRPIFYINEEGKPSYENKAILEKISADKFTWEQLITGFAKRKDDDFSIMSYKFYSNVAELYSATDLKTLKETRGIIDYMDTSEAEASLIAMKPGYDVKNKFFTHVEIHPSLILGVMGNQIVFPENNQLPRDLFACGQAKQAVSVYNTNFQTRMDKMGVVLNNGQIPLVKSRYLKYINNEEHPCGENTIVAIMSYNGYNVEDSILFNEGSLKRGLFRTTYYTTYQSREESSKVGKSQSDSHFVNIEKENVIGKKPGYDYSELDDYGLIKENTSLDEKKVIIGKVTKNLDNPENGIDSSSFPKKGQVGFVDKTFITEGEEGFRIAKVRVRDQRMPAIGDKFSSRCGQKGTLGVVIPEEDMPYTASGIRPDIIINPHAIPSRMTIGQLVETVMGKACSMYGAFGDCTAFVNNGSKHKVFGQLLTNQGMHSSGSELLYNGQTGEQLETEIFMGPTYYMRLKHMVKDKINYRALGPRTSLTRQPVQGRANDGGLRIGEMERDGLIAHGVTKFLQESMLIRGDEYFMAVCNKTGTIAIYNNSYNLFLSPFADGPIKFSGTLTDGMNVQNISRYGRSFSVVRIPYAFKLLIQELQTMNIQLRLITEDNIDQLTSMSFSDNINKINSKFISGEKIFIDKADSVDAGISTNVIKFIPVGLSPDKKPAGQTKLFANKFLKFKMPKFVPTKFGATKFGPTSSNLLDIQYKLPVTDLDRAFASIHRNVNDYKTKLDQIEPDDFRKLSENLDLYAGLKRHFMKKGFPFATNASLKMYELIKELNLIDCDKPIRAFCDAELPGAFIVTINHFVKTICKNPDFDWVGSSYYPEAAAKAGDLTILGDEKYGFYTNNRSNWLIGPKPNALPADVSDTTGDLMNGAVVVTLANAVHARFASTSGATLATSDAGIDVSEDYSNQECDTSLLNYGQIIAAILALAPGGHMVTKQYTFNRPFSRSLIALVSLLFEEALVVKPVTSRPGNSEIYLVGKGFLGIEKPLAEELVQRFSVYSGDKSSPCKYAPLFNPDDYKAIDEELLKAASKIHNEQQVEFLNEMNEYYENKDFDLDLKEISNKLQKEWLKKYPLVEINKTDMMYYKKYPNPNPLSSAAASANDFTNAASNAASNALASASASASAAANAASNFANSSANAVSRASANALSNAVSSANAVTNAASNALSNAVNSASDFANSSASAISNATPAVADVISTINNTASTAYNSLDNLVSAGTEIAGNALASTRNALASRGITKGGELEEINMEDIHPSILTDIEENNEDDEKPEENNKKTITI